MLHSSSPSLLHIIIIEAFVIRIIVFVFDIVNYQLSVLIFYKEGIADIVCLNVLLGKLLSKLLSSVAVRRYLIVIAKR